MKFREHYRSSNYTNFLHTGPKPIPLIGHINPVLSFLSHLQKNTFQCLPSTDRLPRIVVLSVSSPKSCMELCSRPYGSHATHKTISTQRVVHFIVNIPLCFCGFVAFRGELKLVTCFMQIGVQEINVLWESSDEIRNPSNRKTRNSGKSRRRQGRLNVFIRQIVSLVHKNPITDTNMSTWN